MNNLAEKIRELDNNAEQKLRAAEILASNGDFPTASAILVTAFEERTKALVAQLMELGFPLATEISELDYVFKHHDTRHYIGFFVDCMHEIFDDVLPFFLSIIQDEIFRNKVLKLQFTPEMENAFLNWMKSKTKSFLSKVDFYQNIEKHRQCGLYIDILRDGTTSEQLSKDDYLYIKDRLNAVHSMSKEMKEIKQEQDAHVLESIEDSRKQMLEHNMPSLISQGIEIVKKERKNAFKRIRRELNAFSETLIE